MEHLGPGTPGNDPGYGWGGNGGNSIVQSPSYGGGGGGGAVNGDPGDGTDGGNGGGGYKIPQHIKIQKHLMDMLDLVVQTSGLPVAAAVESMTDLLVVRVKVVTVLT